MKGLFGIHHSDAGDLVSMSYLDNVKNFREPFDYFYPKGDSTDSRNIDLYIYGDSYLEWVHSSAFHFINSYHYSRRSYNDLSYTLDPNKRNILIIEYAERFARGEFRNFEIFNHVKKAEVVTSAFLFIYASSNCFVLFRTMRSGMKVNPIATPEPTSNPIR